MSTPLPSSDSASVVCALLLAGGRGERAAFAQPKQLLRIGDRSVLHWGLSALASYPHMVEVNIVLASDLATDELRNEIASDVESDIAECGAKYCNNITFAIGGASRRASVANGLEQLASYAEDTIILVHDSARPALPRAVIERLVAAIESGAEAAVPVLSSVDSMARISDGQLVESYERTQIAQVQTPQAFRLGALRKAHAHWARDDSATEPSDDSQMLRAIGERVAVVEGDRSLHKLTYTDDLPLIAKFLGHSAEQADSADQEVLSLTKESALSAMEDAPSVESLDSSESSESPPPLAVSYPPAHRASRVTKAASLPSPTSPAPLPRTRMAIGFGYDVHQLVEDKPLWLGGVEIAHSHGLLGHSDADVVLHALCDALLGALAEGDIGQHFPPSDPQWRGAKSTHFLRYVRDRIAKRGGSIDHIDVTIIAEAPKISLHSAKMERTIADILEIPIDYINIKATTSEGLGFIGRHEAIAAQAVVAMQLPRE